MRLKKNSEEKIEVNMSSLIDCVFLLLIFFLVATMTKKENRDIDVDLPVSVSSLEVAPDNDVVVIGLTKDREFFCNGRSMQLTELNEKLAELADANPDQRIRLDCDKATPFKAVVEILDLCSFRALRNVGVRTYDEKYNR